MLSLGASKMPLLLCCCLVLVAIGELVRCALELVPILSMLLFWRKLLPTGFLGISLPCVLIILLVAGRKAEIAECWDLLSKLLYELWDRIEHSEFSSSAMRLLPPPPSPNSFTGVYLLKDFLIKELFKSFSAWAFRPTLGVSLPAPFFDSSSCIEERSSSSEELESEEGVVSLIFFAFLSFFSDIVSLIAWGFIKAFALLAEADGFTEALLRMLNFSRSSAASLDPNFPTFYLFR